MSGVGAAFEYALRLHAGQTDKAGEPYIAHLVRVAADVETDAQRIVALLHDSVEDCDADVDEIRSMFGDDVATAVTAITKRESEAYEAYLARVAANPTALAVKLSDMADNSSPRRLALLDEATAARLTRKYATASAVLTG